MGQPPARLRRRVLTTPADSVPLAAATALRAFCAGDAEVAQGFICRIAYEADGRPPVERLQFGVRLSQPLASADDGRDAAGALYERMVRDHRDLIAEYGLAVLADRALPAWTANGVELYPNTPLPPRG